MRKTNSKPTKRIRRSQARAADRVHPLVRRRPSMDIEAAPGTKVLMCYPDAGYPYDSKTVKQHGLRKRTKYTVDHTEPHSFHTYVFLREFPGVAFNSVHFCEAA